MISVVMPVYNASRFLEQAVDSVLAQSHKNFELILVDDCSTDNSLELARSYEKLDSRIRVIESPVNQGVAKTRNVGIAEARGEYIALLDSDDVWLDTKLEKQLDLIKRTGASIAYCSYDFIDEDNRSIGKPFLVPPETDFGKMLACSVISCSTALIETRLLQAHPFNPDYYHEDYVLWMELLRIPVKAAGDPEVLAHYRQVGGSRSNNKLNAARERWKIYLDALGLGLWQSLQSFAAYAVNGLRKYWG